jgi:nicotinamide-nucleotide amidase
LKAEIVASGTELLLGEAADTNSSFIASQLAVLGLDLYYISTVGDNYERFLGVLQTAYQRSDIIIVTGGLGPTKGDITRDVIAGLVQETVEIDPDLRQHIIGYFNKLHLEMPLNNLKQATLIPSATPLLNPLGSAPGWWVEKNGKIIISLPGPPSEMQPMWKTQVFPRLESLAESVIVSRTLKTWGISEAKIDQIVGQYMSLANPTLALYAKTDGIQLRITAKADSRQAAEDLIAQREKDLRELLKDSIWGIDKETLEGIIGQLLISKGLTLASAESVTGGLLASSLSNFPDSRQFFKGGIVLADQNMRQNWGIENVEPGIQSAAALALLARQRFKADIGIGIDGSMTTSEGISSGQAFVSINLAKSPAGLSEANPPGAYQLVRRSVMQAFFNLRKTLLEI